MKYTFAVTNTYKRFPWVNVEYGVVGPSEKLKAPLRGSLDQLVYLLLQ